MENYYFVKLVEVDLFIGDNLNIFSSKIRIKKYFFANDIDHIYVTLPLEKLLAIRNTA